MIAPGIRRSGNLWTSQLERLFEAPAALLLRERGVRVRVVADPAALAAAAPEIVAHPSFDRSVQAAASADRRSVWFIASAVRSIREALGLFAHEVVGHYALPEMLGHARFGVLQAQILRLRDAGQWPELFDQVRLRYERAADGSRRPLDDATFAAEAIAVFAEANVRTSFVQRAANGVRGFLRRLVPDLMLSQGELRQMLWEAGRWAQGQDARLSVADRALGRGVAPLEAPASPVYARSDEREPFYSALLRAIEEARGAPKAAGAEQWRQWLDGAQRRGECKQAERDWVGVDAWLDQQDGPVTRDALAAFVRENQVEIREVVLSDRLAEQRGDRNAIADELFGRSYENLNEHEREMVAERQGPLFESGVTNFAHYQLAGGQNYRELLLTLPDANVATRMQASDQSIEGLRLNIAQVEELIEEAATSGEMRAFYAAELADMKVEMARLRDERTAIYAAAKHEYESPHWKVPNILAHVRFNERVAADGKRVLFLEELQSDWHKTGKKQGYGELASVDTTLVQTGTMRDEWGRMTPERQLELRGMVARWGFKNSVPDAPLKKEWPLTAMKRMIRWAAEHGFDRVAWTTGAQQVARYDLGKQLSQVMVAKRDDGMYVVTGCGLDGPSFATNGLTAAELTATIGKGLAERAIADIESGVAQPRGWGGKVASYSGCDLRVGGEGMHAFYDDVLPNELARYVKKWGGKVTTTSVSTERSVAPSFGGAPDDRFVAPAMMTQPCIDITPAMREVAMQGQPLFAKQGGQPLVTGFRQWFGGSKVVDEDGSPLVVYHGTNKDVDEFRHRPRAWAANNVWGHFFTRDASIASEYAGNGSGVNVVPVFLSLQNPYVMSIEEWQRFNTEHHRGGAAVLKERLIGDGYDGIMDSVGMEFVAFHPEQIKSAIGNNGDFSSADARICFAKMALEDAMVDDEAPQP